MVFLTMFPEEIEHTREPAYYNDLHWPPVFNLQPRSNSASQSERPGTDDTSSSQDECNIKEFILSKDPTPPSEETPLEDSVAKDDATATIVEPALLVQEQPVSGIKMPDTTQTPLTDMLPPVVLEHSISVVALAEPPPSGDVMTEGEAHVSSNQLRSSEISLPEEFTAATSTAEPIESGELVIKPHDPDAVVGSKISDPAADEKTAVQADLKLPAESHSHEITLASDINAEDRQKSLNVEAPTETPAIAISCPATFSATDPPSTRLRHMIANSPSIILCPGVYDGLSARIALLVGFKGMYMTGAGTTASRLGASDLGIAHLHDMHTNAEMIANLQPNGPPLIADMDTGYGGPLIISRAVKQYARAGVAAFHIEDQVPEKRCGHLSGKEVVDIDAYLRRIRACLDARTQIRSDIIIIARTDALQSRGYDECLERLRRARDLGADMGILEGVSSKETAAQAVRDLAPWPLCYNSVENGHSPLITAAEAQAMGYRLMIFSFAGIAPAYTAILNTFTMLKEHGVTGCSVGPKTIFEVCGLDEEMRVDRAAGGSAFAKGV